MLLLRFVCQYTNCSQVVLHLLKGGQHRLTIIRDIRVVLGNSDVLCGPPPSGIEKSLGKCGSHGPEPAWPVEPVQGGRSLKSHDGAKRKRWIVSRLRDADLLVCGGHAAFICRNVGAPLEQCGGYRSRNPRDDRSL